MATYLEGGIYETQIDGGVFLSCIFVWLRPGADWRWGRAYRSYRDVGSAIYGGAGANQGDLRFQTRGREVDRRLLRPVRPPQGKRHSKRKAGCVRLGNE